MFGLLGAGVINADLLAHRSLRKQGACYKKVVKTFGGFILKDGQIDRKKLAEVVFASPLQLRKLERIIHPFVLMQTRKEIATLKKNGKKVIVLDVPLLFESGMDKMADMTLVVKLSQKKSLLRSVGLGQLSRSQALERLRFQLPMAEKVRRADIIIDNGGTLKKTEKQVKEIFEMIRRRYFNYI